MLFTRPPPRLSPAALPLAGTHLFHLHHPRPQQLLHLFPRKAALFQDLYAVLAQGRGPAADAPRNLDEGVSLSFVTVLLLS